MKSDEELLDILAEKEGYSDPFLMLEAATFDSIAPAICTTCESTYEMEPDQREGRCENCGNSTVKSCLVLARII